MHAVVFYEKPGCLTNAKQKAVLEAHGCELAVRNLLTEPWSATRLYAFLSNRPVAEWFNPAAPRIKFGEIDPQLQDRHSALALLLKEPLLIRRPLLDTGFGKTAGFDDLTVLGPLGISADELGIGIQSCSRSGKESGCPEPR
jgi:nitrogenase-associated protein